MRVASIYSIGLSEMSRLQEEFSIRYPQAQLHVVYLRPQKIYEAPDFLIDVQKPEDTLPFEGLIVSFMIGAISMLALGFMLGLFFGKRV